MWSDYRQFGITESALQEPSAAYDIAADTGGFCHILATTDLVLTDVVLRYPRSGVTSSSNWSIPAGGQLLAVKSATISSGYCQVFYFKS